MNSSKKITIMIFGVITVSVFWIAWVSTYPSDKKAMSMFVSVEELIEGNIAKRTKLGGLVKKGSIQISNINQLDCDFILKEGANELKVKYTKTRPDLFKDGAEVIVSGQYINGTFFRDSTNLGHYQFGISGGSLTVNGTFVSANWGASYLDSPSSSSQISYYMKGAAQSVSGGSMFINVNGSHANLTLMEIAG